MSTTIPPHNLEAERAVLGTVLLGDNGCFEQVAAKLAGADFFKEGHRIIFDQMRALRETDKPIDLITLSDALREAGHLEAVGGSAALALLVEEASIAMHLDAYIHIIREKATKREALHFAKQVEHAAQNDSATDEVIHTIAAGAERLSRREAPSATYEKTERGLVWRRPGRDGPVRIPLTNFTARIVATVVEDNGTDEPRRLFEIEASLNGQRALIRVSPSDFFAMAWPAEHLGASAIVYAGVGRKDHARAAIQILSGRVPERRLYVCTGWRQLADGRWAYLHAGGAIGAEGAVSGIEVVLPEQLKRYLLPEPPPDDELVTAVRASLQSLEVAPKRVTVPIYGMIWRASLGDPDFSGFIEGESGAGKTAYVTLALNHYGADWTERNLPTWSSTGNALEELAFIAKDALFPVDDFAPSADPTEARRLQALAERLFRAQGNIAGRQRMRADLTLRPPHPPRGLVVSTGEDTPRGQSLGARLLVLRIEKNVDINWPALTRAQRDAERGLYAQAFAGYIRWLARQRGQRAQREIREELRAEIRQLRDSMQFTAHRRTPAILADLVLGLRYFRDYATDIGAVNATEAEALWRMWMLALAEVAGAQRQDQEAADPVQRYLELLTAAMSSGKAHVADATGDHAEPPHAWGWRLQIVGTGENERKEWRPQGARIGWLDDEDLYLEPHAVYAAARQFARDTGEELGTKEYTLRRRLHARGLLVSTDTERGKLPIRKTLEGRRRLVLHVRASSILPPEPAQSAQPAHDP